MSKRTAAQKAKALEAIYAIEEFDIEQAIALFEVICGKTKSTLCYGEWTAFLVGPLEDLISDLKAIQAGKWDEDDEAPRMPATIGADDQPRWGCA